MHTAVVCKKYPLRRLCSYAPSMGSLLTRGFYDRRKERGETTCNKNSIPYDTAGANKPNGIRLGSAAAAARGLQPADMEVIAHCIDLVVTKREAGIEEAKALVAEITKRYPLHRQ